MDFLDIEKIILQDDTRGMSSLYKRINKGFIERSTDLLLDTKGRIFICSGFYILNSKIFNLMKFIFNLININFKFLLK